MPLEAAVMMTRLPAVRAQRDNGIARVMHGLLKSDVGASYHSAGFECHDV